MMRAYIVFLMLLAGVSLQGMAQAPKIAVTVPANLKAFVPKGYDVLDITEGDLNRDGYPDAAIVL